MDASRISHFKQFFDWLNSGLGGCIENFPPQTIFWLLQRNLMDVNRNFPPKEEIFTTHRKVLPSRFSRHRRLLFSGRLNVDIAFSDNNNNHNIGNFAEFWVAEDNDIKQQHRTSIQVKKKNTLRARLLLFLFEYYKF